MCDFCKTFDFSAVRCETDKSGSRISLAGGSYRFPLHEQFNFCPVCGRAVKRDGKSEEKYIFRSNVMLRSDDMQKIREEIKRQLEEGVLLLNAATSYEGREIEICGHKVTVELIERDGSEANGRG